MKQRMEQREEEGLEKRAWQRFYIKNFAVGRLGLGMLCLLSLCAFLHACYVEEDGWAPIEKDGDNTILVKQKNIETVKEHLNKPEGLAENYKLTEDVRLTLPLEGTSNWVPIGNWGAPFTGVFDGNGHSISGLTINRVGGLLLPGETPQGLGMFANIGPGAVVKNLELKDVIIHFTDKNATEGGTAGGNTGGTAGGSTGGTAGGNTGGTAGGTIDLSALSGLSAVGAVVGQNDGGTVQGCNISANISSNSLMGVGGIVGANNQGGMVQGSYFSGYVQGNNNVGGVVGWNNNSTVKSSHSAGSVKGNTSIGGAVGTSNAQSLVEDCHSSSAVEGQNVVGGLVGMNADKSKLLNSHAIGAVIAKSVAGGLVGANDNSEIYDSHAEGGVDATDYAAGGVAGSNTSGGRMERVYAWGGVGGGSAMGGVVGANGEESLVKNCYSRGNVRASEWFAGGVAAFNMGTIENCYAVGRVAAKGGKGRFLGIFGKKLEAGIGGIVGILGQECDKKKEENGECYKAEKDGGSEGACEDECKPGCKEHQGCENLADEKKKEECRKKCDKECDDACKEERECNEKCEKKCGNKEDCECDDCGEDGGEGGDDTPIVDDTARVIGCMALNWSVVAHKHNNKYSWRIIGGWKKGRAENNYAYGWLHTPDMKGGVNGDRRPTEYLDPNSKDGASIIPRQWPLYGDYFPGHFTQPPWTHVPGKLPGLGGSAVDIPDHIIWEGDRAKYRFRWCWITYSYTCVQGTCYSSEWRPCSQ